MRKPHYINDLRLNFMHTYIYIYNNKKKNLSPTFICKFFIPNQYMVMIWEMQTSVTSHNQECKETEKAPKSIHTVPKIYEIIEVMQHTFNM